MNSLYKKLFLLLPFLVIIGKSSIAQRNSIEPVQNGTLNFTTFHENEKVPAALYEKYNAKKFQDYPDFGILPADAPCKNCVEIMDKRKANERAFVDPKDPKSIFIQKSVGDLNYQKDGKWLAIDDRFKQITPGVYRSDYYLQPVGINTNEKRAFIQTAQGKVYFNEWQLLAKTSQGEKLLDAPDWSHFTAGDDGVYITNMFKGIDAELRVYRGTVKTSFIIKSNEYGRFDQLIFRDAYKSTGATDIAFTNDKAMKSGSGALEISANKEAVLKMYEAIIYPKNNPKNNISTAAYTIHDNSVDVVIPFSWINDNIQSSPLVIDPVVTGTATLAQGNILGSMYNASCSFNNSCDYNLDVSVPPATTITGISFNFVYNASSVCFGSDGGVKLTSGACNTPVFTNQSNTPGPTYLPNVPILSYMQACVPAASCTAQTMPFTMHFYRSCKGPTGCDNSCISAYSPWIMTIKANTVELANPIGFSDTSICVGNSIYVTTFAVNGVGPYNYNWSFNANGTPSLGTGTSTNITFPNIVNHTIFAIITDACGNNVVDSLHINVNYAAVTATPSSDSICSGSPIAINLTGAASSTTFTWTAAATGVSGASNGSGNVIAQTLTATGSTPGTVTYTVTPQNAGCIGTPLIIPVTVFPPVTVTKDTFACINHLPFIWNGQSFMSGGNAIATFSTPSLISGCDSTTILNLTINPVATATQTLTICGGQLPYHWNGHTLTAGGTHIDSFTTTSFQYHCDSTTYLTLHVVTTLTDTVTTIICQNQLPYHWNGFTVTAGGVAAASLNSTSATTGCDSITVLNLTVNPLAHVPVTRVICPAQLPYHWNGLTFTSSDTGSYVTPSLITGCDSTTTLHLIVNPNITASQNKTICASALPYSWNGITVNAGGLAVATYTTPSLVTGCDSITTLNLTVNPLISTTVTITICAAQLPYHWNSQIINAGGNAVGTFTTASSITHCDSTTTLNLIVNPLPSIVVNRTICAAQLPYAWNGFSITAGGNAAAVFVTPSLATGCDSTTTLNLTVNPILTATVNATACANQMPYHWNGQTITAGGNSVATYSTTSAITNCDSTTTLNLTVYPVITLTQNLTICASQLPYHWNGLTFTGTGTQSFVTPSLATGCDSTTTLHLTVNPLIYATQNITTCASGLPYHWNGNILNAGGTAVSTYTTASLVTGCDSTTTLNLTINPLINVTRTITICASQLPYHWNGQTITAGGNAVATYTTGSLISSCDSTTVLNLVVNPLFHITVNRTICATQLPYIWNSISVTAAGSTAATYTTPSVVMGCDSTTTLNLTVNPTLTATVSATTCANALPYHWNGLTVNAGGPTAATFTTSSLVTGCDSITTLNLNVLPVITQTQTIAICVNQLPYHWNGLTINAGGIGAATFNMPSAATGCDSTTILNLNINPLLTATKTLTICASQLPYHWNDITVTAGGNAVATFTTTSFVTGCDSTTTLNLNVNPVLSANQNLTKCINQLPFSWNGITIYAGGSNIATYTTNSLVTGCDSVTHLSLTVNPVITATQTINICSMQLPYHWHTAILTAGGNGVATFTTTSAVTGCDSTTTLNLMVTTALVDTIFMTKCANQLPFVWNGITVTTGGTAAANFFTPGSNSCDSITTLNLTVNPVPNTIIDTAICYNQAPFHWNGQAYSTSGIHVHTGSAANGCDSLATLHLTVYQAPYTLPNRDTANCGSVSFKGNIYFNNAMIHDTLLNALGCDSAYQTLRVIVHPTFSDTVRAAICAYEGYTWDGQTYNQSGKYAKHFTTSYGCDSTVMLDLTVWPLTQVSIQNDLKDVPCTNDTITLQASGANLYAWKSGDLSIGQGADILAIMSQSTNVITVNAKDVNGCESNASISIDSRPCCEMMVPNAFSPNGDGLNDKFGAQTLGNPLEYEMRIYNRFGQLLYTSHNIDNKWDGTYNGKLVDMGTYFYNIYTKCTNNSEKKYKGDLTLIR